MASHQALWALVSRRSTPRLHLPTLRTTWTASAIFAARGRGHRPVVEGGPRLFAALASYSPRGRRGLVVECLRAAADPGPRAVAVGEDEGRVALPQRDAVVVPARREVARDVERRAAVEAARDVLPREPRRRAPVR